MKVIILCPRTPRLNYGGLENFSLRLAEKILGEGHEAEIFTTAEKPLPLGSLIGPVRVREFPVFAPNDSYYFSLPLYNALRKEKADIIHSVGYNNLLTFAGLLAKKPGQKYVVSINLGGDPPPLRKILNFFYDMAVNFFADRIDHVICVSPFELNNFRKRLMVPENKFSLIPMGVEIERIRKVKAGKKGNYILAAGRFVHLKQFHNLIPAFALVAREKPDVKLMLIGSGPLEAQLRQQVKELGIERKVVFEKPVPLDKMDYVRRKMKESLMFANLVDCGYEGIISYEAMACEVPVLLTDSRGVMEYVKKGYAQAVTDPNDHVAVKQKIMEILGNPGKYTPHNPEIYSWKQVNEEVYRVYKKVLKQN